MAAIIKTWPAFMPQPRVREAFSSFAVFYFTIGRGKPARQIDRLFFTHQGLILGSFAITEIVQNVGQLPKLRAISGEESEWQIRPDSWVAICDPPFDALTERIYHDGFRGFRYFDLEAYRRTIDSKVRV